MIRCPQCNAILDFATSDSLCPKCNRRLSDELRPADSDLQRTLDEGDLNSDFDLGTAKKTDPDLSPRRSRLPNAANQTVDTPDDVAPSVRSNLGETIDEGDLNQDLDWSQNAPPSPPNASQPIQSPSSKTLPDRPQPETRAVDLGKTIDSDDFNRDFVYEESPAKESIVKPLPTTHALDSSRRTLPDTKATLPSGADLGKTIAETDANLDFELGRASDEAPGIQPVPSGPNANQQTIPDTAPSADTIPPGKGTIPEKGFPSTKPLGATLDESLQKGIASEGKLQSDSDATAMTFDSNIDLKPHSTLAQEVASMRTLDESNWNRVPHRNENDGATLDVDHDANSETGDFSVDGLSLPINATIHIRPGDLTLGEEPIPIASARTKNAGATLASQTDNVDDAPDELLLKSISKRSLANEDARAAGVLSPDYKIVKKLGEGGMGVVYSAIQKSLDRHVAVKAIKGGAAVSNDARRKFFYEARITGDLDHPNIVPIHEIGTQDDGTLFYSMKMVDGTPWQDVIKQKSREENLEIFMKVCDAVAFAHSRNVAHRDLKPENVMLGAFGEVLVMDWGLAIQLPPLRPFGMSGTPAYMSPEMAKHDVPKIGKSSDIYILGGILYELITGSAPHSGRNVRECLMNAMHNEIVPTDMVDPLLDIARHAMATQVEDRYATVLELKDAIRKVMQHAESISLTRRAEDCLSLATRSSDYQGFSRACFSMQEAIDLWPENQAAIEGLAKAKFAYGQSALERGDYDLCLQVMEPSNPEHAAKMQVARKRKEANLLRESRLRLTKRILIGVVLTAAGILSMSTAYALRQAELARQSAADEKAAKNSAEQALVEKGLALEDKEKARSEEAKARVKEATAKEEAVRQAELARQAKNEAEVNAREAVNQSRIAILGSYQSKITLANAQSVQLETPQSTQSVRDISTLVAAWPSSPDANEAKHDPRIEDVEKMLSNWAIRRIQYFNNEDLPKLDSDSPLLSMDYDPVSGWLVALDEKKRLRWLRPDSQKLEWDAARDTVFPTPTRNVAIAPGGRKLVVLSQTAEGQPSALLLLPEKNLSIPVDGVDRKPLQRVTFTENGQWLVGGINTGLWRWQVLEEGLAKPSVMNFRGTIDSLHGLHGDKANFVFGISRLPQNSVSCFVADLENEAVYPIQIPSVDSAKLTTAAMAPDGKSIVIGFDDGNLVPMAVAWRRTASNNGTEQWMLELEGDFAAAVEKFRSQRWHRKPVEEIRCFRDGSIMSRASEPVIPVWSVENGNQLSRPRFLTGLPQAAQFFEFLQDGDSVLATDSRGCIMRWNRKEQSQRNGQLVLRTPQIKDAPAVGIVNASFDNTLSPLAIDENGVLLAQGDTRSLPNAKPLQWHYVGHSPYANVISAANARANPWIATLARLSKNSYAYLGSNDAATELCVWNRTSGKMLTRIVLPTGPNARLSFLHSDAILCVTDGTAVWNISTNRWLTGIPDQRFGAALSIAHPTQPNLFTLIANSGSVRIVDATDPSSWDNDAYRNFDLAINNRSLPMQATWSPDGLCLFILFDNGRLARLKWDGRQLTDLNWSNSLVSGIDAESDVAWHFVDLNVLPQAIPPGLPNEIPQATRIDSLRIAKRTSESNRRTRLLLHSWARDAGEPTRISDDEVPGDRYFVAGQANAWSPPNPPAPNPAAPKPSHPLVHVLPGQGTAVDAVDASGAIHLFSDQEAAVSTLRLGSRQPCRDAVCDPSGRHWLTLHQDQAVWFAQSNDSDGFEWSPFPHDLLSVRQMTFNRTGDGAWLIGLDAQGVDIGVWYSLNRLDNAWVKQGQEPNIRRVLEDIEADHWILITADRQLHRGDWKEGQLQRRPLTGNAVLLMPEFEVAQMAWFQQLAGSDRVNERTLMLLSNSPKGSRIDWLALDSERARWQSVLSHVSPNEIASLSAAPSGNIFVTGDRAGTLGVWFASPQIDEQARPLFNLPNHAGNRVTATHFSIQADRLLSADSAGRVFGWYTTLGHPPAAATIVSTQEPDKESSHD